ncbi:MAG: GpE family phage tail protein [Proteobacteria bacterium]|nr:GpE family phage tail protein [Pseudomonadota bacterium]
MSVVAGVFHFGIRDLHAMTLQELKFWYDRAISFIRWVTPKKR